MSDQNFFLKKSFCLCSLLPFLPLLLDFERRSWGANQDGFQLKAIFLAQPAEFWGNRHASPIPSVFDYFLCVWYFHIFLFESDTISEVMIVLSFCRWENRFKVLGNYSEIKQWQQIFQNWYLLNSMTHQWHAHHMF